MAGATEDLQKHFYRASYHAVARFVERILAVELQIDKAELPETAWERPRYIAERYCQAAGRTLHDIRAEIMVPAVIAACLTGISQVRTSRFRAVINPKDGVVVTIAWRDSRKIHRLKSARTKAEQKRGLNRACRSRRSRQGSL